MCLGGTGGLGHVKGGAGALGLNCTTGGTACQAQPSSDPALPGYSDDLFCGAGGFSHECNGKTVTTNEYAGPGGKDGNWSAGMYITRELIYHKTLSAEAKMTSISLFLAMKCFIFIFTYFSVNKGISNKIIINYYMYFQVVILVVEQEDAGEEAAGAVVGAD